MKATLIQVQKSLTRLAAHYPEAGHSPQVLKALADDYFEAFKGYESMRYHDAVSLALKRCKYFPKIADIEAAAIELAEQERQFIERKKEAARRRIEAGPTYKSDHDIEKAKERLGLINQALAKEITVPEAIKRMCTLAG